MPRWQPWNAFLRDWRWMQGQHVTLVGPNGSGKTTLALRILPRRKCTIVLATKPKDSSLYGPLLKQGYTITDDLDKVDANENKRIVFRPKLDAPTRAARDRQKEAFGELLSKVYTEGGWTIYADEVRYITQTLKLAAEMELLWVQGRSIGITVVAATQRPRSIPQEAWEMAPHLFLWRNSDQYAVRRIAEFMADKSAQLRYAIPRIPWHEVIYAETQTGQMVRTKVNA